MLLNPVFSYIKYKDTFTYQEILDDCKDKVIDEYYIYSPVWFLINGAYIKKEMDPLPEKIHLYTNAGFGNDEKECKVFGYNVLKRGKRKHNFKKYGILNKTILFNELQNMTNPYVEMMGYIIDLDSKDFITGYFINRGPRELKNKTKYFQNMSPEELHKLCYKEISRALYYIAIHHNTGEMFPLKPGDRSNQWQRVVDLGIELEDLRYKEYNKKQKVLDLFKLWYRIINECENMC